MEKQRVCGRQTEDRTMIKIKDLTFTYNKKDTVLSSTSLSIHQGERWSIIGRNGAGKSTLIRCIAGLETEYQGIVSINNKNVLSYPPRDLAKIISYVPQTQDIRLPFTVYEYVMMGRFPYQGLFASATLEDKKCVQDALDLTDTSSFATRSLNTLSGGELQRVLLAGAVSQRTDILLLDEPGTFLDPFHQLLIEETLKRIHDEYNCTIITVTHDINKALFGYDNVLALVDGKVYFSGKSTVLFSNYKENLKDIFGVTFVKGSCAGGVNSFVMPEF